MSPCASITVKLTFSPAKVPAYKARIKELEQQLADEKAARDVEVNELKLQIKNLMDDQLELFDLREKQANGHQVKHQPPSAPPSVVAAPNEPSLEIFDGKGNGEER